MFKRMLSIIIAISVMLAVCSVRIYFIGKGDLKSVANGQSTYTMQIAGLRGRIYDCNKTPFTNNVKQYGAVLIPTVKTVAAVTSQLDGEVRKNILSSLSQNTPCLANVTKDFNCTDAFVFENYQSSTVVCPHTIGYLDIDNNAVTGIEYAFDDVLKGENINISYAVDANKRPLDSHSLKVENAQKNENYVQLTLDLPLCKFTENLMKTKVKKGSAVVIDSNTGEIKCMVSTPYFDTKNVSNYLYDEDAPLINRSLENFNVGSVFKICVCAAALKKGISNLKSYECKGSIKIGENTFNCSKSHGLTDMSKALSVSCNCYFIRLAEEVGAENIYDMCIRLGFNRSVTLADTLKADEGVLPSIYEITNYPAALANFSFGQGELMLSPLHICAMISAVNNSGKYKTPYLVKEVNNNGKCTYYNQSDETVVLNSTQSEVLKQMLCEVIKSGTGKLAQPENGVAFGKTATAEGGEGKNQCWFAGGYKNYAIVVLCEDGVSGGQDAAPVFKSICDYLGS
ncbi:MAG: penicillin-binding transpeptidase domain-containing protein [Acutalibacteraceae bacterium]|nr:penicillin-binding transpeptidase domain-containing protein [Acutalibacteraceae bacterium]